MSAQHGWCSSPAAQSRTSHATSVCRPRRCASTCAAPKLTRASARTSSRRRASARSARRSTTTRDRGPLRCEGRVNHTHEIKVGNHLNRSPWNPGRLNQAIVELSGCKIIGLSANSLGSAKGIILEGLHLHNCVITLSPMVFGVLIEVQSLTVEMPTAGLTAQISGSFVAPIKKTKANGYLTKPIGRRGSLNIGRIR